MLKTETNTPEVERQIREAAIKKFGFNTAVQLDFEHGQWWLSIPATGAQYSVVDAEGGPAINGFDFEEVTPPDEDY